MCITEYNEELALAQRLEDGIEIGIERGLKQGREEGREEGKIETKKKTAKKLFEKGQAVGDIADILEVDVVDVQIWLNESAR